MSEGQLCFLSLVLRCICNSQVKIVTEKMKPRTIQGPDCNRNVGSGVRGYG